MESPTHRVLAPEYECRGGREDGEGVSDLRKYTVKDFCHLLVARRPRMESPTHRVLAPEYECRGGREVFKMRRGS
ncbi:hypothetical protein NDU88_006095 [Pleurodeles waltl]|uniref:Uncharacterized protein n=1 Tax=Pleurodeles waltl TaxID=8319 RepID=A0AAV7WBG5_PLEWA|nr:hypothetical protein NDU88_006095 [Pleurodeles waltl]